MLAVTMLAQESLTPRLICGLVWRSLTARGGQRPTIATLACYLDMSERQLRRIWRLRYVRAGGEPLRTQVTYGCVTFALLEISTGCKCVAAVRQAGFRSLWNFNRQCRAFGLGSSSHHRSGARLQLSVDAVHDALREYDESRTREPAPGKYPGGPHVRQRQTPI